MLSMFWVLLLLCNWTDPGSARTMSKRQSSLFHTAVNVGAVKSSSVTEASGLAASRRHPGILYTHNDSGGQSRLFAIDANTGKRIATLTIRQADNEDWEDIAVGPCGNHASCIYIGDIGDHGGRGAENKVYRLKEPVIMEDASLDVDSTLLFSWDEPDAETVMVDPAGEVYIISKVRGSRGKVAQLPSSAWGSGSRVAVTPFVTLPLTSDYRDPVGGDISPDGREVLIKGRQRVYYWQLGQNESYASALARRPTDVPYTSEPQGETVSWSATGSSYYTLGEGEDQPLYNYVRKYI